MRRLPGNESEKRAGPCGPEPGGGHFPRLPRQGARPRRLSLPADRLPQIGEEPVGIACRSGKAKLLLVAKDAGDHTFRRARSFVSGSKCPYVCVPYTKDELGDGLGCNACALCAFTEPAFAKSFLEALGDETHADILAQLTVQTQRVQKRRQEAQAHRKNVKMGKK